VDQLEVWGSIPGLAADSRLIARDSQSRYIVYSHDLITRLDNLEDSHERETASLLEGDCFPWNR
jgi:hypothetical protein